MIFTGERFIPGISPKRIEEDHLERYYFASKFSHNKKVLDIACGVGYGAKILIDNGKAKLIDAVDNSIEAILYAKTNYQMNSINFYKADILHFKGESLYDLIVCFETIEHIPQYEKALKQLNFNLKKGGILLISSPNRNITSPLSKGIRSKPKNKFHSTEFLIYELIKLLENNGFIVDQEKDLYGQRLITKKEFKSFSDELKFIKSAKVKNIKDFIPRYFIIKAKKI